MTFVLTKFPEDAIAKQCDELEKRGNEHTPSSVLKIHLCDPRGRIFCGAKAVEAAYTPAPGASVISILDDVERVFSNDHKRRLSMCAACLQERQERRKRAEALTNMKTVHLRDHKDTIFCGAKVPRIEDSYYPSPGASAEMVSQGVNLVMGAELRGGAVSVVFSGGGKPEVTVCGECLRAHQEQWKKAMDPSSVKYMKDPGGLPVSSADDVVRALIEEISKLKALNDELTGEVELMRREYAMHSTVAEAPALTNRRNFRGVDAKQPILNDED